MSTESESFYADLREAYPKIQDMLKRLATGGGNQALAIVSSAMLEESVKELYVACILPKYASQYRSAGHSRITTTALHMGLLHKLESDLLGSIASIRNGFAHNWSIDSFYDGSLEREVRRFRSAAKAYAQIQPGDMLQPDNVGVGELLIYVTTVLVFSLKIRAIAVRGRAAKFNEGWPAAPRPIGNGFMFASGRPAQSDTTNP